MTIPTPRPLRYRETLSWTPEGWPRDHLAAVVYRWVEITPEGDVSHGPTYSGWDVTPAGYGHDICGYCGTSQGIPEPGAFYGPNRHGHDCCQCGGS